MPWSYFKRLIPQIGNNPVTQMTDLFVWCLFHALKAKTKYTRKHIPSHVKKIKSACLQLNWVLKMYFPEGTALQIQFDFSLNSVLCRTLGQ